MLNSQLNQKCLEVLHASSVKDFSKQITEFIQNIGFDTVAALVVTDHSPTLTEFQSITNAPKAYRGDFDNLEEGRIDPVSQHCKRSNSPIVWDRRTYATPREQKLWERQAEFGYRSGIAFAVHPGRGRHFMFGANWGHDRCIDVANHKEIFEDLLMFASHAQAAAFDLCIPSRPDPGNSWSLARNELEALRWSMDGNTSWEVAEKMSLSERHATLLLQRAMRKLNCSSKYEAALRAIQFGLIKCS